MLVSQLAVDFGVHTAGLPRPSLSERPDPGIPGQDQSYPWIPRPPLNPQGFEPESEAGPSILRFATCQYCNTEYCVIYNVILNTPDMDPGLIFLILFTIPYRTILLYQYRFFFEVSYINRTRSEYASHV